MKINKFCCDVDLNHYTVTPIKITIEARSISRTVIHDAIKKAIPGCTILSELDKYYTKVYLSGMEHPIMLPYSTRLISKIAKVRPLDGTYILKAIVSK